MKFLTPIILLIVSGVVFFWFVDPTYSEIKEMKKEEALFTEALDNSKELQAIRDELLLVYNSFSVTDLNRLEKILPNNVDNVRLVRDIDGIANTYGMTVRSVKIETGKDSDDIGVNEKKYGSIVLTFSVTAPYRTFITFLKDLEKSLRIVDVVDVSFSSAEKDLYEYNIAIRTYWLK